MRWFILIFILVSVMFVGIMGERGAKSTNRPISVLQDMDDQYKVKYQDKSAFFADGVGSRKPVEGTIPMGLSVPDKAISRGGKVENALWALDDSYYATGQFDEVFGTGFPTEIEVDEAFLSRGEERFNIYCAVCHGKTGEANGPVAASWTGGQLTPNANLTIDPVLSMPDGQIFHTITHGKGLMGPYGGNITIPDRWAIVAYIRALQASRTAPDA